MLCDLKIIVLNNYGMYFTKNKMQYINFCIFPMDNTYLSKN